MQRRSQRGLIHGLLSFCLILACSAPALQAEEVLRQEGRVVWSHAAGWFGGFSGAEVSADGQRLTTVSDRGHLVQVRLVREGGTLAGVEILNDQVLKSPEGRPLIGKRRDAEALAQTPDGRIYIAFEHGHRVMRLDPQTGVTTPLPRHPDFANLQPNSGLEALAAHPDGRLLALPERAAMHRGSIPVYAFDGTAWHIAAQLPRRGPFLPVGADVGPDGRLYLLERTIGPLGFRSRIRRFALGTAGLEETTLLRTGPGAYDNLEAISLWQDNSGQTRLILLSDDNFFGLQRTELVELTLAKAPPQD